MTKKERIQVEKIIKELKVFKKNLGKFETQSKRQKDIDELNMLMKTMEIYDQSYTQSIWLLLGLTVGFSFNIGANLIYDAFKEQKIMLWLMFLSPIAITTCYHYQHKKKFEKARNALSKKINSLKRINSS